MTTNIEKGDISLVKKELSNNILTLILVIIIFVSIMGTFIVLNAISEYKEANLQLTSASSSSQPAGTTSIGFTVLPPLPTTTKQPSSQEEQP